MAKEYDVIIVGAGVVGLATAAKILASRPDARLLVLEKELVPGFHQTGHNSGVIHSGIYYQPGSLKARNCINGYGMLLDFCRQHGIAHEVCGKIIVATREDEVPRLLALHRRGLNNGLEGLRILSREEMREREPYVDGTRAVLVPQTGIVDFHEFTVKLAEIVLNQGAEIRYGTFVSSIRQDGAFTGLETESGYFKAKALVTCAGLFSDRLARQTDPELPVRILPFRGEYYKLKKEKRGLVRHLIYPVPDPSFPFLGVHFTRMVSGEVEAGPNAVLALKREGYNKTDFNYRDAMETVTWRGFRRIARRYWRQGLGEIHRSLRKKAFVAELQRLIPDIEADDLMTGGAGIRAQACHKNGSLLDDFFIHSTPNVLHVCNAPSPAATSAFSIGEEIAGRTTAMLN